MKKTLLFVVMSLLTLNVLAQHEYTIEGHVEGLPKGTVMTLFRNDGRVGTTIANDTIGDDGKFVFKQKVANGKLDRLSIISRGEGFPPMGLDVYAEPDARIKITGNDKYLRTWRVESNVEEQIEYNRFIDCTRQELIELQKLSLNMVQKIQGNDREYMDRMNKIQLEIDRKQINLMKGLKVSDVWVHFLYRLSNQAKYLEAKYPYRTDLIALYNKLNNQQKLSLEGMSIKANLFPPKVVQNGEDAVDGDLFDLNGGKHHLSDLKGKYILMDFWSSGCGPCVMSIPEMKEISETYKDKMAVVSLSTDKEGTWKDASARHNMTWNNWNDKKGEAGLYANYGVRGTPHYVVISLEGKLVTSWMGYGKGSLKMRVKRWILDKPSSIPQKPKTDALVIMDVKQKEDATQIRLKVYNNPHTWVIISSNTHLTLKDGRTLKIKGAEGIKLGEEHFFGDECSEEFLLDFEKLPDDCKTFDFFESEGWVINDVMI